MFRSKSNVGASNPGDGLHKYEVYEVWGDVVEHAGNAGPAVIDHIRRYLEESAVAEHFNCQECRAREDGRPFLTLQWNEFTAEVDARDFGEHFDVYAILAVRKKTFAVPDPTIRMAELEVWERRDLQVFQTLLKFAMEEALQALDEGRLLA